MTPLAGPPVTVAAITAGLCGWLVVDEPVELGRHDLAATDEQPAHQWIGEPGQRVGEVWTDNDITTLAWFPPGAPESFHPVPVGRVAATVTVTHCLPIVLDPDDLPDVPELIESDGVVRHWPDGAFCDEEAVDITEQTVWQPGAWLPGRWALQVTDPTPRSDQ